MEDEQQSGLSYQMIKEMQQFHMIRAEQESARLTKSHRGEEVRHG